MTASTETRKRSREDDSSDSMPLSKRINNLHINNADFALSLGQQQPNGTQQMHAVAHPALHDESGAFAGQGTDNSSQESFQNGYNPELNQHENPYYYNKNKLLYELHLERMRRN